MNTTLSTKSADDVRGSERTFWKRIQGNADLLCVGMLAIIFAIRFSGTIFLHKSISKLYLTALWDSLFYPLRAGQSFNMDPSLVQQHIPERLLVANLWHHTLPLWNSCTGFGVPLLADPNAFVLSPIFSLFTLFPNMYTWNIIIIFQLLIGAVFAYLLCRELAFNRVGSCVAALLFAFCPSIQSQCEQVYGSCLIPFVFFFFVRLAKRNSLKNGVLAGIAAAIDLLSANPESAFMTVAFGVALTCLLAYVADRSSFKLFPLFGRFVLAGMIAFGLTAPVLIPFVEYLLRCDSYKFADTQLIFPLQGIFTNFLFPFFQRNNLFWGPLSWWGMVAALLLPNKNGTHRLPLIICLTSSIFALAQIFPVNLLFNVPPFSMVLLHYYVLPHYIFFVSILSGLGIGRLFDLVALGDSAKAKTIICIGLVPLALSLIFSPFICSSWHSLNLTLPYALTIEQPQFDWSRWCVNLLCAITMLAVVMTAALSKSPKYRRIGVIVFVMFGMLDLFVISYSALPIRPTFRYPHTLPVDTSKTGGRFLSLGNHLLKPNINLVYQLPTILEWNALHPKGFTAFMKACGADVDKFGQCYPPLINRLFDLTGTRTIISQQPVLDENAISTDSGQTIWTNPIVYGNRLTITDLGLFQDKKTGALFCHLIANPHEPGYSDFQLYLDVRDEHGDSLLYTEPQTISAVGVNQSITCSSLLPANSKHWTLSLRLVSSDDAKINSPKQVPFGTISSDGSWLIASSDDLSRFNKIDNNRFKLLSQREGILTYENKTALDRYFFVRQVDWMGRGKTIDFLKENSHRLRNVAALEEDQKELFDRHLSLLDQTKSSTFDQSGSIVQLPSPASCGFDFLGSSAVSFRAKTTKPALIVFSDIDYPGWKAFVNGANCPIFKADYLFRAVLIPPGNNRLEFRYEPLSFRLGAILFAITGSAIVVWFVRALRKPKQRAQTLFITKASSDR